jgi:hypothetical protein
MGQVPSLATIMCLWNRVCLFFGYFHFSFKEVSKIFFLTQDALDIVVRDCYIPSAIRPVLPGPRQTIRRAPEGKIGLYTRLFDYTQFRFPLSKFLVSILEHYKIHISQLHEIGVTKVSHFEYLCRVCGIEPAVGLFPYFYIKTKKKGWLSFGKRSDETCYTKVVSGYENVVSYIALSVEQKDLSEGRKCDSECSSVIRSFYTEFW